MFGQACESKADTYTSLVNKAFAANVNANATSRRRTRVCIAPHWKMIQTKDNIPPPAPNQHQQHYHQQQQYHHQHTSTTANALLYNYFNDPRVVFCYWLLKLNSICIFDNFFVLL